MGQKQKTEKKKEEERLNDGDNNGQAMHGAHKHAWRTQAAWAKRKTERLNDGKNKGQATHGAHMVHASRLGQFLYDSETTFIKYLC